MATPESPAHGHAISLLTGGSAIGVAADEIALVVDELHSIADGSPRFADAVALSDRLEAFGRLARPVAVSPAAADRHALLRATDHLRNLSYGRALLELRERLLEVDAARPIPYRLLFADGRPDEDFTSYSGAYEERDRLVAPDGEQLRVAAVEEGDPPRLVVQGWRPLAWHPSTLGW